MQFLKKNKDVNFIIAFIVSTGIYVLLFTLIPGKRYHLNTISLIVLLTFSGILNTLILSYQNLLSLKSALSQTLLILGLQCHLLLLVFPGLYIFILLLYALLFGIPFVSLGCLVGYAISEGFKDSYNATSKK